MFKRVGLFLVVNILVVITISVILNVGMRAMGLEPTGSLYGLAIFCGIFGMAGAFISLSISRWMAKRAYGIKLIDGKTKDPGLRSIYEMVVRQARQAGLPETPEVGYYEAPDANAFATGPSKKKALVAFSTGLFQSMKPHEVEAVSAHEISHIANGDMVTMTLLTGVANALVMFLARVAAYALDRYLSDGEGDGRSGLGFIGYIVVVMLLETVFMAIASIPIAAFSRYREFHADAGSAKLTSPQHMIDALKALKRVVDEPTQKDSYAIAKISSGRRVSLWSTHPSLEDRIERLKSL